MRVEHLADGVILWNGDCRDVIPMLSGIDVIITDPPYGVTDHVWDVVVPAKDWMIAGSVCFASEPYATTLVTTSPQRFKYDLVWEKNTASNAMNAARQPMRTHERVLIFGDLPYYPQKRRRSSAEMSRLNAEQRKRMQYANPGTVLFFDAVNNRSSERTSHPSQKPVPLLEYLIRSYSSEGQTVLDPFTGSGSTAVACILTGRKFVGVEKDELFFDLACRRISNELSNAKQEAFL